MLNLHVCNINTFFYSFLITARIIYLNCIKILYKIHFSFFLHIQNIEISDNIIDEKMQK